MELCNTLRHGRLVGYASFPDFMTIGWLYPNGAQSCSTASKSSIGQEYDIERGRSEHGRCLSREGRAAIGAVITSRWLPLSYRLSDPIVSLREIKVARLNHPAHTSASRFR